MLAKQGIAYLYMRKTLAWNQPDFAIYTLLFTSVQVLGTLLVLPLLTGYLGLPDSVIGILSLFSNTFSHILIAFVTSALVMYLCNRNIVIIQMKADCLHYRLRLLLASLGHLLTLGILVVIRSMLSKIVKSEELSDLSIL